MKGEITYWLLLGEREIIQLCPWLLEWNHPLFKEILSPEKLTLHCTVGLPLLHDFTCKRA